MTEKITLNKADLEVIRETLHDRPHIDEFTIIKHAVTPTRYCLDMEFFVPSLNQTKRIELVSMADWNEWEHQ